MRENQTMKARVVKVIHVPTSGTFGGIDRTHTMKTKEELAEEYINSIIPLEHKRCSSDFLQELQKIAFLAGYETAIQGRFSEINILNELNEGED